MSRTPATAAPRLYGRRWAKARAEFLADNPYCFMCTEDGKTLSMADIVDHVIPHRGDPVLFWDENNWQSLCRTHHNAAKQSLEKSGRVRGCTVDGVPIDPGHHWAK